MENKAGSSQSRTEKLKLVIALVDKIPVEKNDVLSYHLDWLTIDDFLLKKRIRPWIKNKFLEYSGKEYSMIVNIICSKLVADPQIQDLVKFIRVVLNEQAEEFVIKMWRVLIYETEAYKAGYINTV